MTIADATFLSNSTLYLRSVIASGTTDPVSATRPSGSHFVNTSFPDRLTFYPIIAIQSKNASDQRVGAYNDMTSIVDLQFQIDIFSKSTKERDNLFDSVYHALRTSQYTTGSPAISGTTALGLYDFKLLTTFPQTESQGEKDRLHRQVLVCGYKKVVTI